MKKTDKIRPGAETFAVSEAAAVLGVSTPTLKRMVEEGRLEAYRTPGGHLRILAESVEGVRERRQVQPRQVREASPVLHNRRERLEEVTLEAQEVRARRELAKLQREEQDEEERREAEAEARDRDATQRQAELELERERLEYERTIEQDRHEREAAQEQERREREAAQERQRRQAERELTAFRCRWLDKANDEVSVRAYNWLSATQRKEILDGLEAEIAKRQPADEPRMPAIIARSLEATVEPFRAEHDAQERRQRLTEEALRSLPYSVTEAEKVRATAAIREALRQFDRFADVCEMRVAAQEAVQPIRQAIERRTLDTRLLNWAISQLPLGKTDRDEARVRRECAEILADLAQDASEVEGKEALEPTIREACQEVEERRAQQEQRAKKARLVAQGVAEVSSYLLELTHEDEITLQEYLDSDLMAHLKDAVERGLEADLTGDESAKKVRELARGIIDGELG